MICRVKIDGEVCEFSSAERSYYSANGVLAPELDAYGLWNGRIAGEKGESGVALSMKELIDQGNQFILIGEGDCGKSVAMRDMAHFARGLGRVFFAMLRDYRGDKSSNLFEEILAWKAQSKEEDVRHFIFLDGIDENEKIYDPLKEFIKRTKGHDVFFIVSSRPIEEKISSFSEDVGLKMYRIAPFTMRDVMQIAEELDVDSEEFFKIASEKLVLSMCKKPELCIQLLRRHCLGKLKTRTIKQLYEEITTDLCREHRDGLPEQIPFRMDDFTDSQILDASSWIAVVLSLQKKKEISEGSTLNDKNAILVEELVIDKYSRSVIHAVMQGRLFEPMSSISYRIGVEEIIPFLAAKWLAEYLNHDNIRTLLVDRTNPETGRLYDVLGWVEIFIPGIAKELMNERPELILLTEESIKRYKIKDLYKVLCKRYWKLPREDRELLIVVRLSHLKDYGVQDILRRELSSKDPSRIIFAGEVVKECVMTEMTSCIVDVILDNSIGLEVRESLSYVLLRVCYNHQDDTIRRLRAILNVKIDGQLGENIWANVLRCLYSKYVDFVEVLHLLREPLAANYYGAYAAFIEYTLPISFNAVINERNASSALAWAVQHIYKDRLVDRIGCLARGIFTFCWRFGSCAVVRKYIVECIWAYLDKGKYEMPFLSVKEIREVSCNFFSRESYFKDKKVRLDVFFDMVQTADSERRCSKLKFLMGFHSDFPIVNQDDFEDIAKIVIAKPQGLNLAVDLIGDLTSRIDLGKHAKTLRQLQALFPSDARFDINEIKKRLLYSAKQQQDWELESKKKEKRNQEKTIQYRKWMHDSVRSAIVEKFSNLVYTMSDADGSRDIPPVDIRESVGWGLLDEQERSSLKIMGLQFLRKLKEDERVDGIAVCCAVKLSCLQISDLKSLKLTKKGLLRLFKILVSNEHFWNRDEDILKIVYELHRNVDGSHLILVDVIVDNCLEGILSPLNVFSVLLKPLDVDDIIKLLQKKPPSDLHSSRILKTLSQIGGSVDMYVSSLFDWRSRKPPSIEYANMLKVAVELSPKSRMKFLLRWIVSDVAWGKQWIETVLRWHEAECFVTSVLECKPSQIATFLIFLDREYPDSLQLRHSNELAYSPDGVDEALVLKSYLVNALMKSAKDIGVKVFKSVAQALKAKKWTRMVKESERVQRVAIEKVSQARLPPITLKELKSFLEPINQNKLLIYTSESLRRFLEGVLNDFNIWLRDGGKTKNVDKLWRRVQKDNTYYWKNKNELSLSDEINDFIKKKAVPLSSFREPMVAFYDAGGKRRRGFADLIVHAQDPKGVKAPAEVIIEVKGNWNPEVKSGMKNQLVDHYLKNMNSDSHGIFLCGCFNLKNGVRGYRIKEDAQKNLELQHKKLEKCWRERVGVSVLDCSLEGVPRSMILS